MQFLDEFKINWRYLVAAGLGLGFGYTLNTYITGIFAPKLLEEFGWSRAQFALTGATGIVAVFALPIAGRLTDIWGVRRVATIGVILGPLLYLALSALSGPFIWYLVIATLQAMLVGATTTTVVYSRLIAERFSKARGSALALAACVSPIVAALGIPALSGYIETEGWRAGYVLVAAITGAGGAMVLMLVGGQEAKNSDQKAAANLKSKEGYRLVLASRSFRIMISGMFLCNLTVMVQASQLKLILLERHAESNSASMMLSLYAVGVVVGRLCCGLALDRLPSHLVAAVGLGLPGVGLLILAGSFNSPVLMCIGVVLLGVSMGAELDIIAYLVMRHFDISVYSTAYSLIAVGTATSGVLGSLLLGLMLKMTGSFTLFLIFTGTVTLIGSTLFLRLGKAPLQPAHAT